MATTKSQMKEALIGGDTLKSLSCVYQLPHEYDDDTKPPLIYCKGNELPRRKYNAGLGLVEGELTICYGKNHVYVKVIYDGMEYFEAVPLSIENVQIIPLLGSGGNNG